MKALKADRNYTCSYCRGQIKWGSYMFRTTKGTEHSGCTRQRLAGKK